jgi:hypothetical protein
MKGNLVGSIYIMSSIKLLISFQSINKHGRFGYLAKQLQRRRYLEVDQSETRTACGGHIY